MSSVTHWLPQKAGAEIAAHRIVEPKTADGTVEQAAADSGKLVGISGSRAVGSGDTVEVAITGIADVEYGAAVTRGDLLTADSDGKAVTESSAGKRIVGIALKSGVDGDIGEVLLSPGSV